MVVLVRTSLFLLRTRTYLLLRLYGVCPSAQVSGRHKGVIIIIAMMHAYDHSANARSLQCPARQEPLAPGFHQNMPLACKRSSMRPTVGVCWRFGETSLFPPLSSSDLSPLLLLWNHGVPRRCDNPIRSLPALGSLRDGVYPSEHRLLSLQQHQVRSGLLVWGPRPPPRCSSRHEPISPDT